MARAGRIDFEGGCHHVVYKGVDGQPIFFDDEDRLACGRLLGEAHERFGVKVVAYCLMTNHVHLIMWCPDGNLSSAMQHVAGSLASFVNRRTGREGHLFARRFYSCVIDTDVYLMTAVRYVERNALDLPGVNWVGDYRWSSFRANAGLRSGPEWLDSDRILGYFRTRDQYRRFVERDLTRTATVAIDFSEIDRIVGLVGSMHGDGIINQRHARIIKVLLLEQLSAPNGRRLRETLGFRSSNAERSARRRAREHLARHPELMEITRKVLEHLYDVWGLTPPTPATVPRVS